MFFTEKFVLLIFRPLYMYDSNNQIKDVMKWDNEREFMFFSSTACLLRNLKWCTRHVKFNYDINLQIL